MAKFLKPGCLMAVLLLALAFPGAASAQSSSPKVNDSVVDGMLIGAAIGAVLGMVVIPLAICPPKAPGCGVVRVLLGVPVIAVGIGVGALTDGLHHGRAPVPAPFRSANSLNLTFRF